jgi:hypothetical protein
MEVLCLQDYSTVVNVATGGQLRHSMTQLVLLVLYLMLRWNYCK